MTTNKKNQQAGLQGFQSRKSSCLSKRDKSSAGRIDPKAVEICAAINDRDEYYTTSSCAGRCFLYRGDGIKGHHHFVTTSEEEDEDGNEQIVEKEEEEEEGEGERRGMGYFERYRVSHDIIRDAARYFHLETLDPSRDDYDASGGGDPVRTVPRTATATVTVTETPPSGESRGPVWLRYEPFILHVNCRTLEAASALMAAARPAFKNVGLTTWRSGMGRYIVAIWGDEGLDMPLTSPSFDFHDGDDVLFRGREEWLAELVNQRHLRNWQKIKRFVNAVRSMPKVVDDMASEYLPSSFTDLDEHQSHSHSTKQTQTQTQTHLPKRYDVIGDIALLHALPTPPSTNPNDDYDNNNNDDDLEEYHQSIGKAILSKNKAIKIVVARTGPLSTSHRSPNSSLRILATSCPPRPSLLTSHLENGIKCVVDVQNTFFSPRMGPERLRICNQVARGENVLVLFCGAGMDALQIVGRTEADRVVAVEINPHAVVCVRRGKQLLERNKTVRRVGAADRLEIVEGDALDILHRWNDQHDHGHDQDHDDDNNPKPPLFDRIVAPRPKEGAEDGDLGGGDGGKPFLTALLPLLKVQGECHWYDFCADWELPRCERTEGVIRNVCEGLGVEMEVIHVAKVGSVAMRQVRICMDFRIVARKDMGAVS